MWVSTFPQEYEVAEHPSSFLVVRGLIQIISDGYLSENANLVPGVAAVMNWCLVN